MTDSAPGKVPVNACVVEAWRFLFTDGVRLLPAALIVGLVTGLSFLYIGSAGPGPDGRMTSPVVLNLVTLPFQVAASAVFAAAVLRRSVRGESAGVSVVSFGADELRLMAVAASLALIFLPFIALVLLAVWVFVIGRSGISMEELQAMGDDTEAISNALAAAIGPGESLAVTILSLVVLAAVVVVAARLAMVNAATIGERRIVLFQTWRWSAGNVRRVVLALLLVSAPAMLVGGFVTGALEAPLASTPAGEASMLELFVIGGATGLVSAILSIPSIALGAILYRGLRPPDFVAK